MLRRQTPGAAQPRHVVGRPTGLINVGPRDVRLLLRGDGYSCAERDDIAERSLRKSA
ncbi:hypothetical protein [Streptomyces sp. MB09-02B]|uniref:hypothetical protein n=1 Tax=Streptomyces sp. MB09-02B TaxID=3028667 RepID=UPI0029ADFF2A|nr:hypothetical protein [Streptomyces sp. MB09-02B]MDX3643933.1 hypothetical protein [Streptomyces sp. MB09-02B]